MRLNAQRLAAVWFVINAAVVNAQQPNVALFSFPATSLNQSDGFAFPGGSNVQSGAIPGGFQQTSYASAIGANLSAVVPGPGYAPAAGPVMGIAPPGAIIPPNGMGDCNNGICGPSPCEMGACTPGAPCNADGPVLGQFPMCEPHPPRWYFRADAVWLQRDEPNTRNLTIFSSPSNPGDPHNNQFIRSTDDADFHLEPGMKLTLGRYVTDRTSVEGIFFGTNNWSQHSGTPRSPSVDGSGPFSAYWGNPIGTFDTSAFFEANQQVASYQTTFDSVELNVRHWVHPTTSILFGFRYLYVRDQFQLSSFNDAQNALANEVGQYRVATTNNLFGIQCGSEYTHELFTRWLFLSVEAKTGIFGNAVKQKNVLFNTGTTDDEESNRGGQFAGMFDLSAALTALVTNQLTIRGGYNFLFLDGLALSTDQLDTNPTLSNSRQFIASKGSMTLQGPFVGGEFVW